jgi:hypothetical protein
MRLMDRQHIFAFMGTKKLPAAEATGSVNKLNKVDA